jgi:hypothetical protein
MILLSDDDAQFARTQLVTGCETLERLLLELLELSPGSVATQVHAVRKLGKSLRGGFALFQMGRKPAREIQAVGRLLAGARDATSRLSTLKKLDWLEPLDSGAAIRSLLEHQSQLAAQPLPAEALRWCLERTSNARQCLDNLTLEESPRRIAKGLKKLHRQALIRCSNLDLRNQDAFHDARKALKAYAGAVSFLPPGVIEPNPLMLKLGETLGDENDLATFELWLSEQGFTEPITGELWPTLKRTQKQMRKQLIREARRLITARAD